MSDVEALEFRTLAEREMDWRFQELRLLKQRLSSPVNDAEEKAIRRALVTLLYAHFEGAVKFLFAQYVSYINNANMAVSDACSAVVASSCWNIFRALVDENRKSDFFRKTFKHEPYNHRFFRFAEFAENISSFSTGKIIVDPINIVNTELNLSKEVFEKNLYRLGLGFDVAQCWSSALTSLLKIRNAAAHGERLPVGIEEKYEKMESDVKNMLTELVKDLSDAIENKRYRSA